MRKALVGLAASMLAGCINPDHAIVREGSHDFDGELVVGETVDVHAAVFHPEFEGSAAWDAVTLETSDVRIVRTQPGGAGFYVYGIAPGTATLHLTASGDHLHADFVVTVKEAP